MTMNLKSLIPAPGQSRMPVLFVAHGNPMNAILDNDITTGWKRMAEGLNPRAILCISAHWQTVGSRITMAPKPATIHDFYGFPPELHAVRYPAPGSPPLGREIIAEMKTATVLEDHERGLDHGAWTVIRHMFPNADIPVLQLSLDRMRSLREHIEFAGQLSFLREKGVLVVGSGNLVHNLRLADRESDTPYDWAVEFDEAAKQLILDGNIAELVRGDGLGRAAALSIPTREHYLPLLYTLALRKRNEQVSFFNETILMGSMGMRPFVISQEKQADFSFSGRRAPWSKAGRRRRRYPARGRRGSW